VILVLALGAPHLAQAGLLTGTFVGTIESAEPGNRIGASAGDSFSLAVSIDPDLAVTRRFDTSFSFSPGDVSFLSFQIGGLTFDEEDDVDFGEENGLPFVFLSPDRSRIVGVDLIVGLGLATEDELQLRSNTFDTFASFALEEDIQTSGRITVRGRLNFVPEPPLALALGLAMLLACRRRAK
jgi:hypothetical protein